MGRSACGLVGHGGDLDLADVRRHLHAEQPAETRGVHVERAGGDLPLVYGDEPQLVGLVRPRRIEAGGVEVPACAGAIPEDAACRNRGVRSAPEQEDVDVVRAVAGHELQRAAQRLVEARDLVLLAGHDGVERVELLRQFGLAPLEHHAAGDEHEQRCHRGS